MSNPTLYMGAAALHPTEEEREDGAESRIIVQPYSFLAQSEDSARMKVVRAIPDDVSDGQLDQVEVLVRPL